MRRLLAIALVLASTGCLRTRFDRCAEFTVDCRFLDGGPVPDAPAIDAPGTDAPVEDAGPIDAGLTDAGPDAPADDAGDGG